MLQPKQLQHLIKPQAKVQAQIKLIQQYLSQPWHRQHLSHLLTRSVSTRPSQMTPQTYLVQVSHVTPRQ